MSGSLPLAWLTGVALCLGPSAHARDQAHTWGDDITTWRALQQAHLSDAERLSETRRFLETFPESTLAELAYDTLRAHDALEGPWADPVAVQPLLRQLERSWLQHHAALELEPSAIAIGALDGSGAASYHLPHETTLVVGGGAQWRGDLPAITGLARLERGHLGLSTRLSATTRPLMTVGVSATATPFGPYLEAGLTHRVDPYVLLGGRLPVRPDSWIEASAGLLRADGKLDAVVTIEWTRSIALLPVVEP